MIINHGFKTPMIENKHYVLGASIVPKISLQKDRNWMPFRPQNENQFTEAFDTYGCTIFGTLNALETLKKRQSGVESNYSDRFTYIDSGTHPPGNDPHLVAESVRHTGVVQESSLPFRLEIATLAEFDSLEQKNVELYKEANNWRDTNEFLHEWLWSGYISTEDKLQRIWDNLEFSPICVSVRAWQQRENGVYYKEIGEDDTHWCEIISADYGKSWTVFDSYPNVVGDEIKILEWNYDFGFAKRYYLGTKTPIVEPPKKVSFWRYIINLINKYVRK